LSVVGRWGMWLLNALMAVALILTGVVVYLERGWVEPQRLEPAAAFHAGTIGTEVMPLAVALTLPALAPHHFQPAGREAGDWVEQFGFLRDPDDPEGLPIGFVATNYRPKTAAPSPAAFVGFSCALCHTTELKTADDAPGRIVTGPGSVSLNLFAWLDAFQAAIIERAPLGAGEVFDPDDPPPNRITLADIDAAHEEATGAALGPGERVMVRLWLLQIRSTIEAGLPRFDEPYGNGRSREPEVTPTGPTRTLAFRTLVRTVLDRPGNDLPIFTKIATVFSQAQRPRAQFDGGIADLNARSSLAAFAAGATVVNMSNPEIGHNIRAASAYTTTLQGPPFSEVFPSAPADGPELVARGEAVYRTHCFACHGAPGGSDGVWEKGERTDTVIPVPEIGTDPERVMFRHYEELPGRMHALFDEEHPFAFDRDDVFPQPGEADLSIRGYVAGTIDGAYLRAPYLHNGSVLTLAELINLEPRRDVIFRGRNLYDVERVGFASPRQADEKRYFRFDTAAPGNSNAGHDYPWAYDDPARDGDDLRALLAYLKTV
ncbi:MAG TPA: cytochrome c, partial [Candidatus Limnocylindrales bacterium]|nr:cytochrome c [Candidatus Limnocylindrales bacterium]